MKLLLGMPTSTEVDAQFALENLPAIISYTKKRFPQLELKSSFKTGVRTDSNRNWILNEALKANVDYILWLDTDEIYPHNIVEKLLLAKKDIVGTCYYKRTPPYSPVVYVDNSDANKIVSPYRPIDIPFIPRGKVLEVTGIGFGGMLVRADVYRSMGEDKWMTYGKNFHIPLELPHKESHDLIFCQTARKYGYKIFIHTSVRAGHIARQVVTEKHFMQDLREEKMSKITVLMPSINKEKAGRTVNQLMSTAGMNAKYLILDDEKREGFTAMINKGYLMEKDSDYFVYLAEDSYGGKDWLRIAWESIRENNSGLFAFNNGRWHGKLASFGMIDKNWIRFVYNNEYLFNPVYKSHYADTELTIIAKSQGKYIYNPNSILMEVDFDKQSHGINTDDRETFKKRRDEGFDGLVHDEELLHSFEPELDREIKQGIVVVTHEGNRKFFNNLMKSLEGVKYPIYIVVNGNKDKPYYGKKIQDKYENVFVNEDDNYEIGALEIVLKNTDLDEIFLMQDTCEVLDQSLFSTVFETLKGKSVALSVSPCPFGMYLGKYKRNILRSMTYDIPTNKNEAVEMEMTFNQQYLSLDPKVVILWLDFVDNDNIVEKFGEKRMLIENKFIKKYKGCWSRAMIKE